MKEQFDYFFKKIHKFIILISFLVLLSMFFFVFFNKNYTILFLYVGVLICYFISKKIRTLLKFINSNPKYNDFYKQISKSSLTNFYSDKKNSIWIMPNFIFVILVFIYSYLLLSYSFSSKLNNNPTKQPRIISFFLSMIILYFITHTIISFLKIKKDFEAINMNFILNIGIYNLIVSFVVGIIISFLYFTIVKTLFKKNLFFQSKKNCKDNVCFYEPIKTNWIYNFT